MADLEDTARKPTLDQLTFTFVPFAFGLSGALLIAIGAPAVSYARTQHLIWIALVLSTAALALYLHAAGRRPLGNYWRLSWSFGLIAYLMHFYYGFWVMFGGGLDAVYAAQGALSATSNLLLTVVWTVDVALAWCVRSPGRLSRSYRGAVHLLVFASFFTSAVIFRTGTVQVLGALMALVLVAVAFDRWARSGTAGAARGTRA